MQYGILSETAPELRVTDWIGPTGEPVEPIRLEDHAGKVRVLYCFQAWCPGCHSSGFPALQHLTEHFGKDSDVVFAVIQTVFEGHESNGPKRRREMQDRYGLALPFGQDSGARPATMTDYRTGGTPWFIVIGRDGRVLFNDFHLPRGKEIALIDAARLRGTKAPQPEQDSVVHNSDKSRYEVHFGDGGVGQLVYRREGDVLHLTHSEVPANKRGQGYGDRLMERALEAIEQDGLKVAPVCPFTRAYLDRYKRWSHLRTA